MTNNIFDIAYEFVNYFANEWELCFIALKRTSDNVKTISYHHLYGELNALTDLDVTELMICVLKIGYKTNILVVRVGVWNSRKNVGKFYYFHKRQRFDHYEKNKQTTVRNRVVLYIVHVDFAYVSIARYLLIVFVRVCLSIPTLNDLIVFLR